MPDPEETEREAAWQARVLAEPAYDGRSSDDFDAGWLAARRLSESESGTVTQRVHDLLDDLAGDEVTAIFHSYFQEGIDARFASGIIDPVNPPSDAALRRNIIERVKDARAVWTERKINGKRTPIQAGDLVAHMLTQIITEEADRG